MLRHGAKPRFNTKKTDIQLPNVSSFRILLRCVGVTCKYEAISRKVIFCNMSGHLFYNATYLSLGDLRCNSRYWS